MRKSTDVDLKILKLKWNLNDSGLYFSHIFNPAEVAKNGLPVLWKKRLIDCHVQHL